jgi:hypothetical protein
VSVLELYQAKRYAEAVSLQESNSSPVGVETVLAYAHSLEQVGRLKDCYQILKSLHDADPQLAFAEKIASAMCRLGEIDLEVIAGLRAKYPDSGVIQAAESELLLMSGKWAEGFAGFRGRWHVSKGDNRRKVLTCPDWTPGENFPGQLFVVGEQGLGEQILFSRFLNEIPQAVVLVDSRLIPLFRRTFPLHSYLDWGSIPEVTEFDRAVTFGDLATCLKPPVPLIPHHGRAADYRTQVWSNFPMSQVIGLSWASYRQSMADAKSIPVEELDPLVSTCPTITLQYGNPADDLQRWDDAGIPVYAIDRLDLTSDLDGVAALASAVDVVVTCSNTVAHIAGAIGKRTILLAPRRFSLWYWGTGDTTPWYPSVEIVRGEDWKESVRLAMILLQCGAE